MKTQVHGKQDERECHYKKKCDICACRQQKESRRKEPTPVPVTAFTAAIVFWAITAGTVVAGERADGSMNRSGGPGLLIIAHGSPAPRWNEPVLAQERKVAQRLGPNSPFTKVKVVFMEFAEPNVADGIAELEQAGCSRIVAVPLLIAPSSHSHWDIPALLGIYSDAGVEKDLRDEGAHIVRSQLPITLTTTLANSDVIEKIMLTRVRQLSTDPNKEAVVLLTHGSEAIPPAWESLMKRTVTYICGQTGISYGDWACVGVGQEYSRAVAVIQAAAECRDQVIVIGAYLSLGVKRMHQRWMSRYDGQDSKMPHMANPLRGLSLKLAEQGLLPDDLIVRWIAETAKGAIARHP